MPPSPIEATLDGATLAGAEAPPIPHYLEQVYWWAYVHPNAVSFFERAVAGQSDPVGQFRSAARRRAGRTGTRRCPGARCRSPASMATSSEHLAARVAPGGSLDIVDVLPIQLRNLREKLPASAPVTLHQHDSTALDSTTRAMTRRCIFFLLHEQPAAARRQTLREALRVVKPGGKLVLVDYHLPRRLHPLRLLMKGIFRKLEPYAMDLWQSELESFLPEDLRPAAATKRTWFGGLYQQLVWTR